MLTLKNLRLSRDHKTLLEEANISIAPRQKVGLVGPNGCGKSSLFALIRGELASDQGVCEYPKQWRLAFVEQEINALDSSCFEYVLAGHDAYYQCHQSLERAEQEEDWEKVAELHQIIDHHRWYDLPAEAQSVMHGLGFSADMMNGRVGDLSGGWRVRLALAKCLFTPSDCLLLDEPTNHLDIKTLLWLENYLKNYAGTLIMISHDVAILDAVTEYTLAFDQQQLKLYKGGYTAYLRQHAEQLVLQQKAAAKQQEKIAHLTSFINRFRAKATKAKQAQSRMKQLEKMDLIAQVQVRSPFSFEFQTPDAIPNPIIRLKRGKLGYGEKVVLEKADLYLGAGDRIGLVGENGAGKSTLAKSLVGELEILSGEYYQAPQCIIAYFAQHQLEQLPKTSSPLLVFKDKWPHLTEQQIRTYLGTYAFRDEQVFQAIETLSGGEKARLILAILAFTKPHLILLDEPTNHLDIEMRQALSLALQTYEGAVVVISHDRNFLSEIVTGYHYVDNGECTYYESFEQIPFAIAKKESAKTNASKPIKNQDNALQKVEKQLQEAEQLLKSVQTELQSDTCTLERYSQLLEEEKNLKKQVDLLESHWLDLNG